MLTCVSFVEIKEYLRELSYGRTDRRTDRQTDKPKSLTLFNFSWKVLKTEIRASRCQNKCEDAKWGASEPTGIGATLHSGLGAAKAILIF